MSSYANDEILNANMQSIYNELSAMVVENEDFQQNSIYYQEEQHSWLNTAYNNIYCSNNYAPSLNYMGNADYAMPVIGPNAANQKRHNLNQDNSPPKFEFHYLRSQSFNKSNAAPLLSCASMQPTHKIFDAISKTQYRQHNKYKQQQKYAVHSRNDALNEEHPLIDYDNIMVDLNLIGLSTEK